MPNIQSLLSIMQRLESNTLHIEPQYCVVVRNRNSTCHKCAQVCPSGCISIQDNMMTIDGSKCYDCGSCSTICPTEAIISKSPYDKELLAQVNELMDKGCIGPLPDPPEEHRGFFGSRHKQEPFVPAPTDKVAVVCARQASKHVASNRKAVQVPCLSRVDESLLVHMMVNGVTEIDLIDCNCATCKYHATQELIDTVVASSEEIFKGWGSPTRVLRTSQVPEWAMATEENEGDDGVSRRAFFTSMRDGAKDVAVTAAQVTAEDAAKDAGLLSKDERQALINTLRVDQRGNMPHRMGPRRERMLTELCDYPIQGEGDQPMVTRLWSIVTADEDKCKDCGVCATFCPSGALRRNFIEEDEETAAKAKAKNKNRKPPTQGMLHDPSECTGCQLCIDSCFQKALTLEPGVSANRVMDFESYAWEGKAGKKAGMFGFNKL